MIYSSCSRSENDERVFAVTGIGCRNEEYEDDRPNVKEARVECIQAHKPLFTLLLAHYGRKDVEIPKFVFSKGSLFSSSASTVSFVKSPTSNFEAAFYADLEFADDIVNRPAPYLQIGPIPSLGATTRQQNARLITIGMDDLAN